ncbi:MAG: LPS assembly lipoprotein LptE [Kiritimatiellales bacterium]
MKLNKLILPSVAALILSGCGYTVKSSLPASVQTVAVRVENKTAEPAIETEVVKALQAEIQMDGRLKLKSSDDAGAILTVTLNRYDLTPVAYDRRKGSKAREYRVMLTARAVLSNAETGDVIAETPVVRGETDFIYAADLTSSKLYSLPAVAEQLARKIVSVTVTAW